jgi:hypothetical protein
VLIVLHELDLGSILEQLVHQEEKLKSKKIGLGLVQRLRMNCRKVHTQTRSAVIVVSWVILNHIA